MSLRARLTLALIFLATIGLAVTAFVSYASLRTFLLERADTSLDNATYSLTAALAPETAAILSPGAITIYAGGVIPGDCVELRLRTGRVVTSRCLPQFEQTPVPPNPRYPVRLSLPTEPNAPNGGRVRYFTVPAVTGGERYRVRASIEQNAPGYELLLATPLTSSDAILHRLFLIELLVTAVVLVVLAAVGLWAVGVGLRPLDAIARTAAQISGSDLSRRVEPLSENTEIGRLARVLNTMLGQIETAFAARQASERRVRRFVADASHELRTPLAAVRAYAELFTRGAATRPDDLERAMRGVERESERMSVLVDELTLLAHLDEGRPLARDRVDLEDVVAEAVETARALEPDRPIAFESEPAVIVGDHTRLRQLVDNLLANARTHTPAATPVEVALARSGDQAVLRVSDSGPGIGPDEVAHVFERFYRTDESRARTRGGTGLGLSIVAALAEAHGGSAAVTSGSGRGATFTISLPLARNGPAGSIPDDAPVASTVAL